MDKNPFTPTFGKMPAHLAGRASLLEDMAYAFENGPGDPNLSTILIGPRGVGKTALLSAISIEASAHGWVSSNVSASPGMLEDILQRAYESASEFIAAENRVHVREVGIAQVVSLKIEQDNQPQANWRTRMNLLFEKLDAYGIGLLITVDEVTVDSDEMVQFASVYQHFVRENKRVALVMAGLPYQVSELVGDKRISFLRRASQRHLERLADADVENAFLATIEDAGKTIEPDALKMATEAIEGFPFMMQLVGYRAWIASRTSVITVDDMRRGIGHARAEFSSGVLETTYGELSPMDVRFCVAMLEDASGSRLADIAKRMGVRSNYASQYKKRLLIAGIIEERSSMLAFAIPGFRELVAQRA